MLDRKESPSRLDNEKIAAEALLLEVLLQLRQILRYARAHIGVGDNRGCSLKLPILLRKFVLSRDKRIWQLLADQFLHSALVRRISIGMKKQDRDRLDAALLKRSCKRADGIFVQLLVNSTICKKSLTYFETGRPFDER